jgi:colanic acid/amylovoran biosynthesis glycosyltransferase
VRRRQKGCIGLKVAYLINQYPYFSLTFVRREIQALEASGVDVTRFCVRRASHHLPDPLDQEELAKTTCLLKNPLKMAFAASGWMLFRPLATLRAARAAVIAGWRSERGVIVHLIYLVEAAYLCQLLRNHQIDHLHVHFGNNPAAVAMLTKLLGGPPYSFTVHGPDEFDGAKTLSLDMKARHAKWVVGISQFTHSQLSRWIDNLDRRKLQVVRCGLDESFLNGSESVPTPDVARLVFVGRLTITKGILSIVEALRILKKKQVRFHMDLIGDGDQRSTLESAIRDADLGNEISLCGSKSSADVHQYLINSRALILASFAEGLPVVLMEAFALGRVVVASCIAGIPELVEHESDGWLVVPGCVESLAKALEAVLATPAGKLDEMAARGRQKVLRFHNARTEAARLTTLFESPAL